MYIHPPTRPHRSTTALCLSCRIQKVLRSASVRQPVLEIQETPPRRRRKTHTHTPHYNHSPNIKPTIRFRPRTHHTRLLVYSSPFTPPSLPPPGPPPSSLPATMHFALPTRNHRSSPFLAASVPRSYFSRRKPVYALIVLVVLLILLFGRNSGPGRPADAPDTVLVLLVDKLEYSEEHIDKVIENRRSYAAAHGTPPSPPHLAQWNPQLTLPSPPSQAMASSSNPPPTTPSAPSPAAGPASPPSDTQWRHTPTAAPSGSSTKTASS